MLKTYNVPYLFLDGVEKCNCYLSVSIYHLRTSEVFCLLFASPQVSLFYHFLAFSLRNAWTIPILLQFTLEIQEAHLTSLFGIAENVTFTFHNFLSPWIHQSYIFSYSKLVRRYVVCCLFASKYVISAAFFKFQLELVQLQPSCSSLSFKTIIFASLSDFWHCTWLLCWKNPKTQFQKAL